MDKQRGPELDELICEWLDSGAVFPEHLTIKEFKGGNSEVHVYEILDRDERGVVEPLRYARRGKKGFVLRVRHPVTKREYAAKLCIPADYNDGHTPLTEVEVAASLRGGEDFIHLAQVVGRVDNFDGQPVTSDSRPWVCLISEWLTGSTLLERIHADPASITPDMVGKVAEGLFAAVLFLEKRGWKHDDLHLGNIMLVETDPDLLDIDPLQLPHKLKIIDWGSIKEIDRITQKPHDDWSRIAECLAQLHNVLHANRAIASRHPEFMKQLATFIKVLADDDLARNFPRTEYLQRIREISNATAYGSRQPPRFRPFDAISAEHLASDQVLLELFVNHLPWIAIVQAPGPVVLVGPRGCGKSMVFRYMAARTHIGTHKANFDSLSRLGFFGVYVGCASDLGSDLLWLAREPGRPQKLAESITTYFNLVLIRELLRSFALCAREDGVAKIMGLSESARVGIVSFIQELSGKEIAFVRVAGMDPLQAGADALDRARLRLARNLLDGKPGELILGSTFLRDVCRKAAELVPGLQQFPITFLLDDYTSHRLSRPIQEILNSILWQRDASHVFKVSSEPHGFSTGHVDGSKIDANREFSWVDAGALTIDADHEAGRERFVTELLDKRLEHASYVGRVTTLIGESAHKTDPELAKAIRTHRKGNQWHYHGIQVLANAWSGDVATVLHMVREMFARAHVEESANDLISHQHQHQAITQVSVGLRDRVSGYHPFGAEMGKILMAFGSLASELLVKAPDHDRKGNFRLHRKYRIEMTLPGDVDLYTALEQLQDGRHAMSALAKELVRRAIFVELPSSRGKESAGSRTVRWQLRASLLPSFGTSLVRHRYIDIKRIEDFAEFLTNPDVFKSKTFRRYGQDYGNLNDLFPDEDSE
ncbi:MAG: hypothetical protein J0M09_13395 [Xanthomonadales bacterium]|nr:hypothetical protein [Xanthomonadales bacterium]